ncbi:Piwi domain protein [Pedobacter sp. PACM 27299]|uniref:Piwi domain-containing protein n=1 Tax=Pedobacter sp. PACM 27299 TaxID=1727164 RepID=UPI000706330C|nr:Piwi domain-containing protein [Pedobacter sp. PACM 27299]ALL06287.1 Piwi domain protein [Pedobacter sp. PACM 27299]
MQLNFFPITIDFEEFQISKTTYSDETLQELRKDHNRTHSFFRNGDDIYISNSDADSSLQIGINTTKNVLVDHVITSSLIKHIFFRTFKQRFVNFTPVDFYPFRFFSSKDTDDLIYDLLPSHLQGRIAYKKLIEVQLRLTNINGHKQFGFVINIKRNWIFDKSCATLHLEGYDLKGVEVLHCEVMPGLNNILAPNEEFIGAILEINGETATVQTNDGNVNFPLTELFIKKTKFNIARYLDFATTPDKAIQILNRIESKRSEIYNTKNLYNEINGTAKHLFTSRLGGSKVLFENSDGFCFTVQDTPLVITNTFELKTPTFIFDPAGTKTNSTSPDMGLTNFGPYDSINFDTKSPSVLCICHRENRGYFSDFLGSLKDGISNSNFFKKGLVKKYELQELTYNINQLSSFDLTEYFRIIREWDDVKPDLAIIEIPSEFKRLPDNDNPYYKLKAKLLSLEIPVQYISTEKVKSYNEYIMNSLALQIYAKLGGTPWVLPSQKSVDREIIIGIGHSWMRQNQYKGAEQSKVVGITTFLSSDGQYLLGDKVKDVPFENYFSELLGSLTQSFNRLEKDQGWIEGDTVRLIFHIFKPIKNTEFDVISQFIKNNTKYKIKFAFITISKSHPHLLFEPNQPGISGKGAYIPNRASNFFLDSETCIVQMFGPKELKTARQGISTPIQIRIRTPQGNYDNNELDELLYYDLAYIVQQIFSFTYLSWRSFLPGEQPATMLYSNLISKLLSKMRNVSGWDADHLNYSLKRKKWFL